MFVQFPVASLLPGPIRPSEGLSTHDLAQLEAGLHALPGEWDAVPCEGCDGDLSVLLMAEDDPAAPTYVVHREGALVRLDVVHDDDAHARLGAYAAIAPLLRSLTGALSDTRRAA